MGEDSRIVVVASGAHKAGKIHFDDINLKKGYNVVKAYSQSKLANVLFTRELARRVKDISGEYFYKRQIARSSKRSNDPELARRLFEFSQELINELK